MRKKFTTSLEEDLITKLKMKALEEGTEANKLLEKLIEQYVNKDSKTP